MANQRLIYGFHAVNARLWQNPKSITELYVQEGKNDARTRDMLEKAANENVRVHFAIAVAITITTRCESCISVHAAAATKAGATESEIAGALATAIALNAGAAYTYALRALKAVDAQR